MQFKKGFLICPGKIFSRHIKWKALMCQSERETLYCFHCRQEKTLMLWRNYHFHSSRRDPGRWLAGFEICFYLNLYQMTIESIAAYLQKMINDMRENFLNNFYT